MQKLFAVDLAIGQGPAVPFTSDITGYCGRKLRFAALRFSPHHTHSLLLHRPSRWLVTLQREGAARVTQDGRQCDVRSGEMFMIDPSRPFSIDTDSIFTHSIYLEPDALRRLMPEAESLTAITFSCTDGPGALFSAFVHQLCTIADTLDERSADHLADAVPSMLSAALTGTDRSSVGPSRLQALHRQRILNYISQHLCNSALDATQIAAAVNLSTRYIYELFSGEGGEPLMKRVWSERLDRCRRELAAPSMRARSISEVAYYWGFNDLAHFSRAFKQRFGLPPREFRRRELER